MLRTSTNMEAQFDQATGKIRYATRVHLPGQFAPDDLAAWRFHQLSGERECGWNNIVEDAANDPCIIMDPSQCRAAAYFEPRP